MSRARVLADLAQRGPEGLPEAARAVGREVRDHAGAGPADLLEGQDHPQLAHATAVAVVDHGHGPRRRRALVVVGRVVVERIENGSPHATNPTLRSPFRVAPLRCAPARCFVSLRYAPLTISGRSAPLRSCTLLPVTSLRSAHGTTRRQGGTDLRRGARTG